MDRGARYVLEKQWILTLPSVCTLQKHKDNSNQRRCPEHHTRKKTSVFDKRVKNRWATQQLIEDTTLNGTRLGVISRGKVVKMFLDLKHFSYCVTVGCWRKKSRWGRPGPAGVKDHSDPAEETAGRTQYVVCLFFLTGFHQASVSLRHRRIKTTTGWRKKRKNLKRWLVWRYFTQQCLSGKGRMGTLLKDGSQWKGCFSVTQPWQPIDFCHVRYGFYNSGLRNARDFG